MRVDKVRGEIARNGLSQRKVAQMLGMSEKTFYCKMNAGIFRSDELEHLATILNISNPADLFFANDGA